MICDGYTEIASVGENFLVFRPMLQAERDELRRLILTASTDSQAFWITDYFAALHIISFDGAVCDAAHRIVSYQSATREKADEENLYAGAKLAALYPHDLGSPAFSCDQCRAFWYEPWAGRTRRRGGKPIPRTDEPLACETRMGCPRGHWSKPHALSPKNRQAYRHYLECRATGTFPDDAIVRRNARIIEQAIRDAELERRTAAASGAVEPRLRSAVAR